MGAIDDTSDVSDVMCCTQIDAEPKNYEINLFVVLCTLIVITPPVRSMFTVKPPSGTSGLYGYFFVTGVVTSDWGVLYQ